MLLRLSCRRPFQRPARPKYFQRLPEWSDFFNHTSERSDTFKWSRDLAWFYLAPCLKSFIRKTIQMLRIRFEIIHPTPVFTAMYLSALKWLQCWDIDFLSCQIVADYVSITLNMTKKSRNITETYSFTKIPTFPHYP